LLLHNNINFIRQYPVLAQTLIIQKRESHKSFEGVRYETMQ
jgi:hypothetical protein